MKIHAQGAVCLDGSPGGYYIRQPLRKSGADDPTGWVVFHQGGGWCSSDESCFERSHTGLGSSKFWGPTYTDLYEGSALFNIKPFDSFTVVYAQYCDGSSWTGNADAPVHINATAPPIYYRGRRLLDALIDDLLA